MINGEFNRALKIDRKDLLFNKNRKPKRIIIALLLITYSPGNPNFRKWIQEEISILHQDDKTKQLFPKIDVVTRQGENISDKLISSRHWKCEQRQASHPHLPPGNHKKT